MRKAHPLGIALIPVDVKCPAALRRIGIARESEMPLGGDNGLVKEVTWWCNMEYHNCLGHEIEICSDAPQDIE
jgi:hypothetical protein